MTILFYFFLAVLLVSAFGWLFVSIPASRLAGLVTLAIPAVLVVIGGLLTIAGRGGIGIPVAGLGIVLWQRFRKPGTFGPSGGRKSRVRSAALEMELDLDTGDMDGIVLAGNLEGRLLSSLTGEELLALHTVFSGDGDSQALLEAYLDRRMSGWREHADFDGAGGQGGPSGSGTMTKEEAYQILGLEPGATPAEIRKAWRQLMKRAHPDSGGTAFLASKINEAKDVLLD